MDKALMECIKLRLNDDARRTGNGDYLRLPEEIRSRDRPKHLLYGYIWNAAHNSAIADLKPLKPIEPLREKDVAKVEISLGFRLPNELRQLYLEIGDGGFGPYNGIRRLTNWAKDYTDLRLKVPAERGRDWPDRLLPLVYVNGKRICIDADGAIVLWTKGPKKMSEKKWLASFVPQAPSVSEWLRRWVDTPTEAEGGPEGGWTAPGEEVQRRGNVEQEKLERRQREIEHARTISHADLPALEHDLLDHIRARALDANRRTRLASAASQSAPIDLDTITDDLASNRHALPHQAVTGLSRLLQVVGTLTSVTGIASGLQVVRTGTGMVMMGRGAGGKLGDPVSDEALASVDERLGFRLPEPLRQLYRVADGGFGPGDGGLFGHAEMLERYRELTSTAEGPGGEPWPAKLLPLYELDPALGCLDLESGQIVVYDVEEMDFVSSQQWRRAFRKGPQSIAQLMRFWLEERP